MDRWKQLTTPFPGNAEQIQERFEKLFISLGAPEDVALFCRTSPDFKNEIFLVTPAASALTSALGGTWDDVDPFNERWTLLVANGAPHKRLGLPIGADE